MEDQHTPLPWSSYPGPVTTTIRREDGTFAIWHGNDFHRLHKLLDQDHVHRDLKNHEGHSTWSEAPTKEQMDTIDEVVQYFYDKRRDSETEKISRK